MGSEHSQNLSTVSQKETFSVLKYEIYLFCMFPSREMFLVTPWLSTEVVNWVVVMKIFFSLSDDKWACFKAGTVNMLIRCPATAHMLVGWKGFKSIPVAVVVSSGKIL